MTSPDATPAQAPGSPDIVPFTTMAPELARAWRLSCEGQAEAALALAQRVHDEALAADDQVLRANAASHMGWYCFMLAYYEEGILHVLSARDFHSAIGDHPRESWARAILAWLLIEIGAPNEALDEAMLALELAENAKEDRAICFALNVVGVVFWMLGQLDRALEFAERSVELARAIGDRVDLGRWLINLAGIEAALSKQQGAAGDTDAAVPDSYMIRAIALATEAQQLAHETGDSWTSRLALCVLAEYHLASGLREQAATVLDSWNTLKGGSGQRSQIYYLFALGKLQIANHALEAAVDTLTNCANLAETLSDLEIGVPCCQLLADSYSELGHYPEAFRWHREFHDRYTRKSTETSLVRSRVAAIQYETRQLQARVEAERSRADGLEHMNRALAQEAALLMSASMEDVLTGLPNRRGLERALLDVTTNGGRSYAFAMMDIDHFKKINDSFSHALGDDVLRQVSLLLRAATRDADLLFRYGGEEFALLMSTSDMLLAVKICRRVRQAIRNWNWSRIHPNLHVTLSIGLALSEEAPTPMEVMAIADERLYRAKNGGRDRIVIDSHGKTPPAAMPSALLH